MNFYDTLQKETQEGLAYVFSAPVIQAVSEGRFDLKGYIFFLTQAFHHVKHTVPLMMACGGKLGEKYEWVRAALVEYIKEEYGHHEWILNDLEACGVDKQTIRDSTPCVSIELMVAFLYDAIARGNPFSFFGMVLVLEGTSVALAHQVGKTVQNRLNLPNQAFSYLYSHGALDLEHVEFFKKLMGRVESEADQRAVIHSADVIYRLYGDMLRAIPLPSREITHEVA